MGGIYGAVEKLGFLLVDGVDFAWREDGVVACAEGGGIFWGRGRR
jgi:hypothetical protein